MGYFSSGSEGYDYQERWCNKCANQGDDHAPVGCAVWDAHLRSNYGECNNEGSILHMLIPRAEDGSNEKCLMFRQARK